MLYCVPRTWLYLSPVLFFDCQISLLAAYDIALFCFWGGWSVISVVYTTIIIILCVFCFTCVYFCVFCLLSVCIVPCKYTLHLWLKGYWDWPHRKLEPQDACWHYYSRIPSLVKKKKPTLFFCYYLDDHTHGSALFLSDLLSIPLLSSVPCTQKSFVCQEMKGTKATIEKYNWLSEWVKERPTSMGRAVRSVNMCVSVWLRLIMFEYAGCLTLGGRGEGDWFRVTRGVKEEEVEKWLVKEGEEGVYGVKVEETDRWQKMLISIPVESIIPSTQCPCPVSTATKSPQQPVHCAEKTQCIPTWMVVSAVLTTAAQTQHWTERTVQTSLQDVPRRHLLSQHKTLKPRKLTGAKLSATHCHTNEPLLCLHMPWVTSDVLIKGASSLAGVVGLVSLRAAVINTSKTLCYWSLWTAFYCWSLTVGNTHPHETWHHFVKYCNPVNKTLTFLQLPMITIVYN